MLFLFVAVDTWLLYAMFIAVVEVCFVKHMTKTKPSKDVMR